MNTAHSNKEGNLKKEKSQPKNRTRRDRKPHRKWIAIRILVVAVCLLYSAGSAYINIKQSIRALKENAETEMYYRLHLSHMNEILLEEQGAILVTTFFLVSSNILNLDMTIANLPFASDTMTTETIWKKREDLTQRETHERLLHLMQEVSDLHNDIRKLAFHHDLLLREALIYHRKTQNLVLRVSLYLVGLIVIFAGAYTALQVTDKNRHKDIWRIILGSLEMSLGHNIGFGVKPSRPTPTLMRWLFILERAVSFIYIILIIGALIALLA
ncbi:MAG: hypothetical protein U9Q76_05445 [candidate division WOR-3 bacterium]|nr:hypothetical protein [candidate division WOR-3 bacterium]